MIFYFFYLLSYGERLMSQEVSPVDFSGLILGFCSAALSYMGIDSKGAANLPLAKQNIDIIEMLQLKTKGNLNADEEKLLKGALTDLRLKYAESSK